ncbi:hypothetical protein YN1_3790 [Nanoarchaeota archaeon]
MIIYDKEKIKEKIKLDENEEPLFMVNFDPNLYSLRYTFSLYILFAIYFISFSFSIIYNPSSISRLTSVILLIIIFSIVSYFALSYYNKGKDYYIIFTNERLIQIINENIYSISNKNIYNVEIDQNLYEKLTKCYSLKIYTNTLLLNKNLNIVIEIPLLNKEDAIKLRDIINNNIKK